MLNKIGGLARAIYIILAIVAGFVALGMMNVPLVLVVLGLIAGLGDARGRAGPGDGDAWSLALHVGAALGNIPTIGAQLNRGYAATCRWAWPARSRPRMHHALSADHGRPDGHDR